MKEKKELMQKNNKLKKFAKKKKFLLKNFLQHQFGIKLCIKLGHKSCNCWSLITNLFTRLWKICVKHHYVQRQCYLNDQHFWFWVIMKKVEKKICWNMKKSPILSNSSNWHASNCFSKFSKLAKNINPLQVTTPTFTALIQEFTKNENILVIYKNADISKDLVEF